MEPRSRGAHSVLVEANTSPVVNPGGATFHVLRLTAPMETKVITAIKIATQLSMLFEIFLDVDRLIC